MKKRRLKKTKKFIQAACLAAGLTMAGWAGGPAVNNAEAGFAGPPPPIEVSGTISPTTSLTDIVVIYSLNTSGAPDMIYHDSGVADVAGGNMGTFSFQVSDEDLSWYDGESYTVIGVYDESGTASVCIGGPGITAGNTWDSYFAVNGDGITNYTEGEIVSYLQSDEGANLESFYADYFDTIAQEIGYDIPLWNFSDATDNGTAYANSQVVPLPAAVLFLGSGLLGLVAIRRRKKS